MERYVKKGAKMKWISKCDKLPKNGEYVYVYPPYYSGVFDDEPRHVVRWRDGCFVYYLGGSVHNVTWGEITHWQPLPPPP